MIKISELNDYYQIRELTDNDINLIINLYKDNNEYFSLSNEEPTFQTIYDDLKAVPNNKELSDKYYLGYFDNNKLIAVIDLIDGYPEKDTAYLGLLMIDKSNHRKGIGTSIVNQLKDSLTKQNFTKIKLAYIESNIIAKTFWHKLGFIENGKVSKLNNKNIIEVEFILNKNCR